MDAATTDVVGYVFLALAGIAAILTVAFAEESRWLLGVTSFGSFLVPVAIIPQLIKNGESPDEMEQYIKAFFLLAYPGSIVCEFFLQVEMIRTAANYTMKCGSWINMAGMAFRLFLYSVWLIQYTHYGHHQVPLGICSGLFLISLVIALYAAITIRGGTPPKVRLTEEGW